MEAVLKGNTEVDGQEMGISPYCLSLPTIMRHILGHFSTKELIELSLVNKLWNFEARSVMRERGNVTTRISHGEYEYDYRYESICDFESDLENMTVIPISGMSLHISHYSLPCPINCTGPFDSSHTALLDRLQWKHFSVYYDDIWGCCMNCPALALAKQILEDSCGSLEDLTLQVQKEEFFQPIFQKRTLTSLKYLTFGLMRYPSGGFPYTSTFVKALVSRAPNLEELRVCYMDLTVNILEGSSAVLVPTYAFRPLSQQICKELIGSIRLEEVKLCIDSNQDVNESFLYGLIPTLLNASCNTLKTLSIDLYCAVPFMCYGICFENVTTLKLHANCGSLEEMEPSVLELAKGFDFTRVFPRLNKVTILDDDNHTPELSFRVVSDFVEQANEIMSRALPERAANIKLLDFEIVRTLEDSTLSFLAQMFPDVITVQTKGQLNGASFTDLREHFLCLEQVIVDSLNGALE